MPDIYVAPLPDLRPETLRKYGITKFQVGAKGNVFFGWAIAQEGRDLIGHRLTQQQRLFILNAIENKDPRFEIIVPRTMELTREFVYSLHGHFGSGEGFIMVKVKEGKE